jgi:hypothetical protein
MTDAPQASPSVRRLTCSACGTVFDCGLGGDCWCAAEPYRLPVSDSAGDCLCPACLRQAAARHGLDKNRP